LAQIDRALAAGQLTFSELTIGDATDELRAQVQQEARQLAARQLMAYANEARAADLLPDRAQLRAVSSQRLPRSYPITLTLDLGLLFADGTGGQHIQVSPTTIAVRPVEQGPEVQQTTTAALPQEAFTHPATSATNPAPPQERRVRLAFDAQNTPVVSVEVESAGKRAKLRRPTFREVGLPAGDGPLRVETNYLVGAAFKRELPAAAEWGLDPAALGLAWLRVDARRVQASGAQRIQVTVRYRPAGSGSSDSKQIQFARGDAEWLTGWYLVTRSDTLAGVIEWSWTETSAEGKTTRHPMAQTENPVLEL
jgi:hypothetical protein